MYVVIAAALQHQCRGSVFHALAAPNFVALPLEWAPPVAWPLEALVHWPLCQQAGGLLAAQQHGAEGMASACGIFARLQVREQLRQNIICNGLKLEKLWILFIPFFLLVNFCFVRAEQEQKI